MSSLLTGLALLSAIAWSATALRPHGVARCSLDPGPHLRGHRETVLLATASTDTVLVGPGRTVPSADGGHSGPGTMGPIHGQVVMIARVGGADSARVGRALGAARARGREARAVIVPWDYDAACAPARWTQRTAWLPVNEPGVLTLLLRPDSLWIDGMPVFDAFAAVLAPYPSAHRARRRGPSTADEGPWLSSTEFFDLLTTMPAADSLNEHPERVGTIAQRWQVRHPSLASRYPARELLAEVAARVARAKERRALRAIRSPITGTYRMTMVLDTFPVRTWYVRTYAEVRDEWRPRVPAPVPPDPTAPWPRPAAHSIYVVVAPREGDLPTDCRSRTSLTPEGESLRGGYMYVIDPPPDRSRTEWPGWVEIGVAESALPKDVPVRQFARAAFDEWATQWKTSTELLAPATFRLRRNVLQVEQTTRLADGRTMVLRGERISRTAVSCEWSDAR